MIAKTKPKSLSTLIKEADTQMSLFIRLSAADERGTVTCVSCGARLYWSDADCCHYIDRGHMATRYEVINLAPGCHDCNRFNPEDHKEKFADYIFHKHGPLAIIDLQTQKHILKKWMRPELEELISELKEKVKELRKKF